MKPITISAPGKVMLLGEHSVVYDRPCLVTAVDSRMNVTISENPDGLLHINAPEVNIKNYTRPIGRPNGTDLPIGVRFIEAVVSRMYTQYGLKKGLTITTQNGFSSKYGLGSSSAVSVCMTKAIAELYKLKLKPKQIFDTAYHAVLDVQGVGSGFDVAAATWGGTLYFHTGGKEIILLKAKDIPLVVVYSGTKADTPTIVKNLSKQRQKYQQQIDAKFDEITELVKEGKTALEEKKWHHMGELMNKDQKILNDLGVSTDKIHNICVSAMLAGAYGAKLTGAGGGDCVIILVDPKYRHEVDQSVVKAGGMLVPVETGAAGVRVEK